MKRTTRTSYGAVVCCGDGDERRYLLIQRKHDRNPFWGLPKGRPEAGEEPHETALRETCEEAGVTNATVVADEPIEETYTFKDSAHDELICKTVRYFLARTPTATCVPDGVEVADCAWLSYDEAREQLTYDAAKCVLDTAHQRLAANA